MHRGAGSLNLILFDRRELMLVKSLLVLVIVLALLVIFQQFGVKTNIAVLAACRTL